MESLLFRKPGLGPGSCGLEQIPLFSQVLWASGRLPGHPEVLYDLKVLKKLQAIGKLIKHATQRGIKKLRKLGEIFQSNNQPPRLVHFNLDQ